MTEMACSSSGIRIAMIIVSRYFFLYFHFWFDPRIALLDFMKDFAGRYAWKRIECRVAQLEWSFHNLTWKSQRPFTGEGEELSFMPAIGTVSLDNLSLFYSMMISKFLRIPCYYWTFEIQVYYCLSEEACYNVEKNKWRRL